MRKIAIYLAAGLLLFSVGALADVDPCVTVANTGVTAQVCFTVTDNGNGTFTLTTTSVSVTPSTEIKAINSIGWNTSATYASTTSNGGWTTIQANQHIDGFDPNLWMGQVSATSDPTNGGIASWTFNGDPGTDITFHIQYSNGTANCSAWVSGRPLKNTPAAAGEGCGTTVPEPATLTLLGTGLLALGGKLRRRKA